MSDFVLEDDQQVVLAIQGSDAAGNAVPASFDAGSVAASSSLPTVLIPTVSPEQTSVTVVAQGPEENGVVITVTGTVGGTKLSGSLTIDVTASPLSSITLVPGTPSTNPAPVPAPAAVPEAPAAPEAASPPPPAAAAATTEAPASVPDVANPPSA